MSVWGLLLLFCINCMHFFLPTYLSSDGGCNSRNFYIFPRINFLNCQLSKVQLLFLSKPDLFVRISVTLKTSVADPDPNPDPDPDPNPDPSDPYVLALLDPAL